DIAADETIIQAAWRNGLTWPTICGGAGTCKTCVFLTLDGAEHLLPPEPWEASGLRSIAASLPVNGQGWRLACQAKVLGDIRLRKSGVRRKVDGR
ncbi:MAG: 2Fe-2S iron-sulfur cluster binding domain-containing protein, partial [Gammaproteobacteria bacterium]|nr:2Fe-2S iron-sulfur cluster binding domain-containing protein [Gammaproteobacteria bacterium]